MCNSALAALNISRNAARDHLTRTCVYTRRGERHPRAPRTPTRLWCQFLVAQTCFLIVCPRLGAAGEGKESSVKDSLSEPRDSRVKFFRDAEEEYLRWVARHPEGYVVNCLRSLTPAYLVLHRCTCKSIAGSFSNYTTHEYVKVGSLDRLALQDWARDRAQGVLQPCSVCSP